jgi:signal transduction histidine kinase/uncharacterized protein YhfF
MSAPVTGAEPRRELLQAVAAGTAGAAGGAFLRSLVAHIAEALEADVAFVAELVEDRPGRAVTLASHAAPGIELPEGQEFELDGTPCAEAYRRDVVACPEGALQAFLNGRLEATDDELAALRIFAVRAGAELERRRRDAALRAREAELAASRARVVGAADEERARIGRDLHDGAQQRLIALGQFLDVAARELERDPARAAQLVRQAREQARAAGDELRALVRGLHPVRLAERGLGEALAALGLHSPVPLRVVALPERRLPEVLEATVWFLVAEALNNAARHAGASEVRVSVVARGFAVSVEVGDDGAGGATLAAGTGLHGLTARVEALGGTLEIDSPPGGGTRLHAKIPMAPARAPREPVLEFGHPDDGGLGERLIELVLAGRKTASVSLAREWELEGGPPRIGQRLPVLDHLGCRRATVEVVRVAVLPFGEITEDVVAAESAGVRSHAEWIETQRRFYEGCREEVAVLLGEPGWRLTDAEPVVITWFRLA